MDSIGNAYIKDYILRIKFSKHNIQFEQLKERFSNIDSIKDVEELYRNIKKYIPLNSILSGEVVGSISMHYGHFDSLINYAGLKDFKSIVLPEMEHGINFLESILPYKKIHETPNFIFQGEYKKEMLHKKDPYKPVFCIGPYIHYTKDYYDPKQMQEMKRRYGKTLLVFPSHTYELSRQRYEEEKFVDQIMEYGKDYDTILVNAYWVDLNNRVYKLFKDKGATVVSAGVRLDANFISRLKTIISLSDYVIGNNIGTNIGYCLYLKKPFKLIDSKVELIDKCTKRDARIYNQNYNRFIDAFVNEDTELINQLYTKFWGGENLIKTRQEIKNMILLSDKLIKYSLGSENKFDESVKKLYKKLSSPNTLDDKLQFDLLSDSIKYL